MGLAEAILLGVIEGITEFLPVSSTGHLTITEKLLGHRIDDPSITAFTAIIQTGAVLATLLYFRKDIYQIVSGWLAGLFNSNKRDNPNYRFGWYVLIGSVPIGVIGLLFKDQIETTLRSLWLVAATLLGWSAVMWVADKMARQNRRQAQATWRDTLAIGLMQCLALIPGVSRSGATIAGGLFRGFDRVTATRLSFFLAIPALLAAAGLEAVSRAGDIAAGVGWPATLIATAATFFTSYMVIAWLLRYISRHSFSVFIAYRLALGIVLVALLLTGAISAT
jgi:undecaprenyl-diphosphatase